MPIYEYKCPNGHLFELFQRMSDEPASVCEVCGVGPVERVLHPVAVHYKGSGFYSTDYGKGSGKRPIPASKDSSDSTSSSSSSSAEGSSAGDAKKPKPAEA